MASSGQDDKYTSILRDCLQKRYGERCFIELGRALRGLFRIVNNDRETSDAGRQFLNYDEWYQAMDIMKVTDAFLQKDGTVDEDAMMELFAHFDVDKNNQVSVAEFEYALKNPMPPDTKAAVMLIHCALDKTGEGFITYEDVRGKYDCRQHPKLRSGEKTENQIIDEYLKNFEGWVGLGARQGIVKDGKITLKEFMDYYHGILMLQGKPATSLQLRTSWGMLKTEDDNGALVPIFDYLPIYKEKLMARNGRDIATADCHKQRSKKQAEKGQRKQYDPSKFSK